MIDELVDRQYQAGRAQLNASLIALACTFRKASANAFKVLNRIEYSAPWAAETKRAKVN